MKSIKLTHVVSCAALILIAGILHHESITLTSQRHLALFNLTRGTAVFSTEFQLVEEFEYRDSEENIKRVLVFSSNQANSSTAIQERIVITNSEYQVEAQSEYTDQDPIQKIAMLKHTTPPLLEIVHYTTPQADRINSNLYRLHKSQVLPFEDVHY